MVNIRNSRALRWHVHIVANSLLSRLTSREKPLSLDACHVMLWASGGAPQSKRGIRVALLGLQSVSFQTVEAQLARFQGCEVESSNRVALTSHLMRKATAQQFSPLHTLPLTYPCRSPLIPPPPPHHFLTQRDSRTLSLQPIETAGKPGRPGLICCPHTYSASQLLHTSQNRFHAVSSPGAHSASCSFPGQR